MDIRCGARPAMLARQDGDIVTGWLVKLVLVMAVIALLVYEVLAIVVTNLSLDDVGREVARAARDEYRASASLEVVAERAEQAAELRGAEVIHVEHVGEEIVVEIRTTADTLLVHRIGPLEDHTIVTNTSAIDVSG